MRFLSFKFLLIVTMKVSLLFTEENNKKFSIGINSQVLFSSHTLENIEYPFNVNIFMDQIYMSYKFSNNIMIEPSIALMGYGTDYYSDSEDDYISSRRIWNNAAIGIFILGKGEDLRTYMGARFGIFSYNYKTEAEEIDNDESELYLIAPTFGAEYFISKSFSFSGEINYLRYTEREERDSYDFLQMLHIIEPKFLLRFYF